MAEFRMMLLRAAFTASAFAALGIAPVAAAQSTTTKQTYFAQDPMAPELANSFLSSHAGHGIEIISIAPPGREATQIFYDFGPVTRSARGVCQFTATQVFLRKADDGTISWDTMPLNPRDRVEPTVTMAAIAPAPCPRQSEEGYVALDNGITDVEFVTINDFWKDISKSEAKFDDAAVYLSLIISPRQAARFDQFRTAALKPAAEPLALKAVFRTSAGNYDLAFAETAAAAPSFFLSISKSVTGFQLLNFQGQY